MQLFSVIMASLAIAKRRPCSIDSHALQPTESTETTALNSAACALVRGNATRTARFDTSHWPGLANEQLGRRGPRLLPRWMPWHLMSSEPLTVAAFVSAIQRSSPGSLVLDVGANVGIYSLLAAALSKRHPLGAVVAIDMQPLCSSLVRCHLELNQLSTAQVLTAYVADGPRDAPIDVPTDDCEVMASPSAVAGRFPNGRLRKKNLALDRRTLQQVSSLHLGEHIGSLAVDPMAPIAATKIDTEGFETRVLESLRPVWPRMGDVLLELQPAAWRHHNVTTDGALRTLRDIITANRYRVIRLLHPRPWWTRDQLNRTGTIDVCAPAEKPVLWREYGFDELARFLRKEAEGGKRFFDFLFSSLECPVVESKKPG